MNQGHAKRPRLPRRRVLTLLAASAVCAGLPGALAAGTESILEWRSTALGARVRLLFAHDDLAAVQRAVERAIAEIGRLENIFSLYRPESELCRLNGAGSLDGPSLDLVELLGESVRLGELSGGAFDISVQPLWNLYRGHFAQPRHDPAGPPLQAIAAARALVDYRLVEISTGCIRLGMPGMAVTLNGIAQGYITDRVADLLRDSGFEHVLIDLGEIRALGHPPSTEGWPVRIEYLNAVAEGQEPLLLSDRAVATSAGAASPFDATGQHHHIFDPATGASSSRYRGVSVIAGRATLADGLSTALTVLPPERGIALLERIGDAKALWLTAEGELLRHSSAI
jgi:thiamine biosynthesis lipoprotein